MPWKTSRSLADCLCKCQQLGIPATRRALLANIADQTVSLFEKVPSPVFRRSEPAKAGTPNEYCLTRSFRCSTSRFGIGQAEGSNSTPLGLHRVVEKIGGGWPGGTVFKGRR